MMRVIVNKISTILFAVYICMYLLFSVQKPEQNFFQSLKIDDWKLYGHK